MKLLLETIASPIGTIVILHDGQSLRALDFEDYAPRMHQLLRLHYGTYTLTPTPGASEFARTMQDYLDGDLTGIDRLPVSTGGTGFQRMVWAALRQIPAGTTTSYGRLAASTGRPSASRAVGMANGSNPISIVVPCHRVIGANAKLTGYGGGLHRKEWLIAHERQHSAAAQSSLAFA